MAIPRRQFLRPCPAVPRWLARSGARADTYPVRPVRIIVATTAGGATDFAARLIAQWLTKKLGQSFIVENRSGRQQQCRHRIRPRTRRPTAIRCSWPTRSTTINTALYQARSTTTSSPISTPIVRVMRSTVVLDGPSIRSRQDRARSSSLMRRQIPDARHGLRRQRLEQTYGRRTVHDERRRQLVHVPYRGELSALTDLLGGPAAGRCSQPPARQCPSSRPAACGRSR